MPQSPLIHKGDDAVSHDYKNKEFLVLDLGSYSLKALIGKTGPRGVTVRKTVTVPISTNLYANGDLQNPMELGSLIGELVAEHGLRNHPVIFTFSSTGSFARVLEVPDVKTGDMKEVVDYEMQQFLPADPAAYIMQYRRLKGDSGKSEGPAKLMVGTVPRSFAEGLYKLAQDCSLVPFALDMHPNALSKLMACAKEVNGEPVTDKTIAVVEIGHTLMDVSVYEQGEFQFNRRLMIGGKNIDQRIERVMEVSLDDARMEKHSNTDINNDVFDYTDENRVFNAVKSGVDEWITEVEKVVRFYVARKPGNRIDKCLLYGGGSEVAGIDAYFSKNLEIPTESLRSITGCIEGGRLDDRQMPLFVNAVGALIRKEEHK